METTSPQRDLLLRLFRAAVDAVDPLQAIAAHLPPPPRGRTVVIGAGKAAARMAQGVERHYRGAVSGVVVTRYGHGAPTRDIDVIEAGHPLPDEAGARAAQRVLGAVRGLGPDDLVIFLASGGGSALLTLPAPGLPASDKREITRQLLRCGAPIADINVVRRHLSALKGGRLALACHPARVVTLVVSDVPGDDPAVVASGPTLPDGSTAADALALLERYGLDPGAAALRVLNDPALAAPLPGDTRLAGNTAAVIGSARQALDAAAACARAAGYAPLVLSDRLEGEAREVAASHARLALQLAHGDVVPANAGTHTSPARPLTMGSRLRGNDGELARGDVVPANAGTHTPPASPLTMGSRLRGNDGIAPPCVLLSGGETTVTVRGDGRGGRNAEYLLALAIALQGHPRIHALACDTDGIDGTEDNAGAVIGPATLARSRLDAADHLQRNDAYTYFAALGDLVVTGPTRTNVNDLRAILVEAEAAGLALRKD